MITCDLAMLIVFLLFVAILVGFGQSLSEKERVRYWESVRNDCTEIDCAVDHYQREYQGEYDVSIQALSFLRNLWEWELEHPETQLENYFHRVAPSHALEVDDQVDHLLCKITGAESPESLKDRMRRFYKFKGRQYTKRKFSLIVDFFRDAASTPNSTRPIIDLAVHPGLDTPLYRLHIAVRLLQHLKFNASPKYRPTQDFMLLALGEFQVESFKIDSKGNILSFLSYPALVLYSLH